MFFIILLIIVFVLVGLYIFMIFPSNGSKAKAFSGLYIAHRGLHGGEMIENTLPAFERAVMHGYGIELDVQLSSDGKVVICHDYDLKRVFGIDKKVSELSASELQKIGVPLFSELLSLVSGRVPLVVELKGESSDTSVCKKTAELLDEYDGSFCIESFNPLYVRWFKKHRPAVIRGQLSTRFTKKKRVGSSFINFFLRHLLCNFLGRPSFIAYEFRYGASFSLNLCRIFGAEMFCWTPTSPEDIRLSEKYFNTFIFEGFEP